MILVIVFHLGVAGVAIATVISNVLSSYLVMIGIPAGIQGAIFSVSNVFIQSGINSFGENAIAGSSTALKSFYFTCCIRYDTLTLSLERKERTMSWKTTNLHLMKGNFLAVYGDSALFFK